MAVQESTLVSIFEAFIDQIGTLRDEVRELRGDVRELRDAQIFAECRKYGELDTSLMGVSSDVHVSRVDKPRTGRVLSHVHGTVAVLYLEDWADRINKITVTSGMDDVFAELQLDADAYRKQKAEFPDAFVDVNVLSPDEPKGLWMNWVEFRVIERFVKNRGGDALTDVHMTHKGAVLFFKWAQRKRVDVVVRDIVDILSGSPSFLQTSKILLYPRTYHDVDISALLLDKRMSIEDGYAVSAALEREGEALVRDTFVLDVVNWSSIEKCMDIMRSRLKGML